VLRETVAEYYQVARLTPAELEVKKITLPREFLAQLESLKAERDAKRAARLAMAAAANDSSDTGDADGDDDAAGSFDAPADDSDFVTAIYGGGVLIFDEYGRLKYHVHNRIFGSRQKERLRYLWEAGLLSAELESAGYRAARLSTLHRMRAIDARRFPAEGW
jgi:hypothetical protein